MEKKQDAVFTLMVDNEFGVLTRITALIRRAGWNIRSLAVAETERREVSRLTICLECRNNTLEFVLEKLGKLNCVREISVFKSENQVARELVLVRLEKHALEKLREFYKNAELLFENENECVVSVVCEPSRIAEMLEALKGQGLLEAARTGSIALKTGEGHR